MNTWPSSIEGAFFRQYVQPKINEAVIRNSEAGTINLESLFGGSAQNVEDISEAEDISKGEVEDKDINELLSSVETKQLKPIPENIAL